MSYETKCERDKMDKMAPLYSNMPINFFLELPLDLPHDQPEVDSQLTVVCRNTVYTATNLFFKVNY